MKRKLYDKPTEKPEIHRIPHGADDIARLLGLNPGDTYWDYNTSYAPEGGMKLIDPHVGIAHEGITTLIRGEAHGLTLKLQEGFLDYQRKYLGVTDVMEVTDTHKENNVFTYPEDSVPRQLAEKAQREDLAESFNGKVICSLMPTTDVQDAVQQLGGSTLLTDGEQAIYFNSKKRAVDDADTYGYNVAPHVVAMGEDELDVKIAQLKQQAQDLGLDPEHTKYWIKLDHLVSGIGVKAYTPAEMDFSEIKDWVMNTMRAAELPEGQFMPVVMDIDVGALPEVEKVLVNANIQAVVGPEGVSITGVTFQNTINGHYLGGTLPMTEEQKKYADELASWALPVLKAVHEEGYRGYAGVDMLLCRDTDGGLRGYCLELNARLNGSTSLLSVSHMIEDQTGHEVVGCNFTDSFKPMKDFKSLTEAFNSVLYKGADSGYTGIIPIMLQPDEHGDISGAKVIAVAPDAKSLKKLEKRYQAIVKTLQR